MWQESKELKWHAIYVTVGQEEKAKKALKEVFKDDLKVLVPKRELKERKSGKYRIVHKKLFPGYIIIKGKLTKEAYYKIKKIPMLLNLLTGQEGPLEIQKRELAVLNILIRDEEIKISKAYKENDQIKIVEGPLLGMEGRIESIDARKGRAKVSIDFLGTNKVVQLGIDVVEKI
ncbi:MAG TPA: transcription antiterminator [Clostridiales bacterium]|jgi:transcriptional antiterminator NusG|nr:transcription antiterminator [Clostridiales bacterium]